MHVEINLSFQNDLFFEQNVWISINRMLRCYRITEKHENAMNMKLLVHVKNTIPRAHLVYITEKGIDKLVLKRLKYSIDLRWKGHGERTGDIKRNEKTRKKITAYSTFSRASIRGTCTHYHNQSCRNEPRNQRQTKHKKTATESILYLVLKYRSRGYLRV